MPIYRGTPGLKLYKPTIKAVGGGYTGPGDLTGLGSAVAFYSMRAFKASGIGGNCIDIKRASDSTTQTFVTVAGGFVDTASIATFLSATTGKITKWYDQTGNGHHATDSTGVAYAVSPSGIASGRAALSFTGANGLSIPSVTQAQPFFISAVSIRSSGTSFIYTLGASATNPPGLIYSNSANNMDVYGGTLAALAIGTEPLWTAVGGLFNGASSQGYVNGTGGGVINAGTTGFSSTLVIGSFASVLTGYITEIILYGSDVSANAATLATNQRDATVGYGF